MKLLPAHFNLPATIISGDTGGIKSLPEPGNVAFVLETDVKLAWV